MRNIVVIGGGPAGMMAALKAARAGAGVVLLEQNEKLGKKLYITGKGRCNLTNAADMTDFFGQVVTNPRFLYSAFAALSNRDVMDMVEKAGCPLKTERGNRVFPASDKSSDVIRAFSRMLDEAGVKVRLGVRAVRLETVPASETGRNNAPQGQEDSVRIKGVLTEGPSGRKGFIPCDALVLACGGLSYPLTGSDGSGFALAKAAGHTVTECRPALVALKTKESWPGGLSGLTLKNIQVRFGEGKKPLYTDFGELLFTHSGVSGPTVLSASSVIGKSLEKQGSIPMAIDLKPALTEEVLDARLLRDFSREKNRQFKNSLGELLPASLAEAVVRLSGITPEKPVNQITARERKALVALLKSVPLTITGTGDFNEAIITQGGISVKEINAKTMESKLVKGLFFAGEMVDVDALTGGFNLQIAWSTGALAGAGAAAQPPEQ